MKNAVIVHGMCDEEEYFNDKYPSLSNSHWMPWLQKQLLIQGIFTQAPEMPEPYKPDYEKWQREFERFDVNENTTLVGHSCGGGFLIRWLSENKIKIDKLFLVAPWFDPKRRETKSFFDFEIDPEIENRINRIEIFISENEVIEGVEESVEIIKNKFAKARIHQFKNKGHFTFEEMKTDKFPELIEVILE